MLLRTLLLFGTLLLSSLSACADTLVAFAQDDMKNDFRRAQVMEVAKLLREVPGVEFRYSNANSRTSLLIEQIRGFVNNQANILIVGANDAQALVPVIEAAHAAGVKVIVLDRGVATAQYTSFINSDNREIGRTAGRFIAQKLHGQGRVLLLEGLPRADVTLARSAGFMDIMARYPDIEVIRRTGNYLRRDALLEMEKLLHEGVHLDAIFSGSDSMLSGVRAAMAYHGLSPAELITVGCDYISEAREAILAGEQSASVIFPLGAKETVRTVIRLMRGEQVPHHQVIGNIRLVTSHNAKQIPATF